MDMKVMATSKWIKSILYKTILQQKLPHKASQISLIYKYVTTGWKSAITQTTQPTLYRQTAVSMIFWLDLCVYIYWNGNNFMYDWFTQDDTNMFHFHSDTANETMHLQVLTTRGQHNTKQTATALQYNKL